MGRMKACLRSMVRSVVAAGLISAVGLSSALAAPAADDPEAQAREGWRETIVRTAVPEAGCFHATYPRTIWMKTECTEAPNIPFAPRTTPIRQTVGGGVDFAAQVSGLMTEVVGTFPTVTGVTSETDGKLASRYSLQLNSSVMKTAACNGIARCWAWQQFLYATTNHAAFIQYWLVDYGKCESGWHWGGGRNCFKNSAAVSVPKQDITQLANLKLAGSAVVNGMDTLIFTTETDAYSITGDDTVLDLATAWNGAEFNIVGSGDGTEADFNAGSSIVVKIEVTDGSTSAPTCGSNAGTTSETNNLNLGNCSASGGSTPFIQFEESN